MRFTLGMLMIIFIVLLYPLILALGIRFMNKHYDQSMALLQTCLKVRDINTLIQNLDKFLHGMNWKDLSLRGIPETREVRSYYDFFHGNIMPKVKTIVRNSKYGKYFALPVLSIGFLVFTIILFGLFSNPSSIDIAGACVLISCQAMVVALSLAALRFNEDAYYLLTKIDNHFSMLLTRKMGKVAD